MKLQLSLGLVASYDIQPGNRVGLFWDTNTHAYILIYLPRTHTGPSHWEPKPLKRFWWSLAWLTTSGTPPHTTTLPWV